MSIGIFHILLLLVLFLIFVVGPILGIVLLIKKVSSK